MSASKELASSTLLLNKLNQHDQTPAQVLGMDRSWELSQVQQERQFIREQLPPHKELPDGSFYTALDVAGRALLAEIQPGGIIGMVNHKAGIDTLPAERALSVENIGIVIANENGLTRILALMKTVLNEQGKPVRAPWNLEPDVTGFTEKQLVMASLKRMFDPKAGIEGSQMNSLFDITTKSLPKDQLISSYGCFSHNDPKNATAQNVMRGSTTQIEKVITKDEPNTFIRINHSNTFPLTALPLECETVEEGDLMFQGLLATAVRIAAINPSGMGGGTNENRVFERLVEASIELPEQAQNGVPIGVLQNQFVQSLK